MTKLSDLARGLKVLASTAPAAVKEAEKAFKGGKLPRETFRLIGVANNLVKLNDKAKEALSAVKAEKPAPVAKAVVKKTVEKPVKAAGTKAVKPVPKKLDELIAKSAQKAKGGKVEAPAKKARAKAAKPAPAPAVAADDEV